MTSWLGPFGATRRWGAALAVLVVTMGGCSLLPLPTPPVEATLAVALVGDGTGSVVSEPSGIDSDGGDLSDPFV